MTTKSMAPVLHPAHLADLTLEITLRATPQQVWQALSEDIGRWWPGPFYCGGGRGPRRFELDARPGGRMWEDHGGGDGMLWGTVIHVQRDKVLEVAGAYGSPLLVLIKFELEAIANGTRLRFTEACIGRVDAATLRSKDKGWRFLFDGCLRAHLEGGAAPAWTDDC